MCNCTSGNLDVTSSGFRVRSFHSRPGMTVDETPPQLPALVAAKEMSSSKDDDTEGTCSPSEARAIATRVLLKTVSAPTSPVLRLLSSSVTSTLYWPLESSATLPGVADVSTMVFSGGLIGARPWEKERNRR